MSTEAQKTIALFGGRKITVNFEPVADTTAEGGLRLPDPVEVKVRQIPIRDYERGFAAIEDELALVGFLAGKDKAWALTLAPESYELVIATGREVNEKGFFAYCQRRMELAQKQQMQMATLMAGLPPETLKLIAAEGKSILQASSPASAPRPRV